MRDFTVFRRIVRNLHFWSCDVHFTLCQKITSIFVFFLHRLGLKKAAEDIGFYYAANAAGRLMGTLFSDALYQMGEITICLIGSFIMLSLCAVISVFLPSTPSKYSGSIVQY